jgi:hypothetical protein
MDIRQCRGCGAKHLALVLDLGTMPAAHRFRTPADTTPESVWPLRLAICETCGLAQLGDEIPPGVFAEADPSDLGRRSSTQRSWIRRYPVDADDLIVEVAVAGQEVTYNSFTSSPSLPRRLTMNGWSDDLAAQVCRARGPARLVTAARVLPHVADVSDFLEGVRHVLADDGVAILETRHLAALYDKTAFDCIQHRHACYFSLTALRALLARARLSIVDVESAPLLEGWLVVHAVRTERAAEPSRLVATILQTEEHMGLADPVAWKAFAARVVEAKEDLWIFLSEAFRFAQTLAGYGASARGNTFLTYCGLGKEHLPYLVDANSDLHGLVTPGHHIPISGLDHMLADMPEITMVLSWDEADEVVREQLEYRRRGGRFVSAMPVTRFISVAA